MLERMNDNTISCPDCGRTWHVFDGLKAGDACPSDACPSHDGEPIGVAFALCKELEGRGGIALSASKALEHLLPSWKQHIKSGGALSRIEDDVAALQGELAIAKEKLSSAALSLLQNGLPLAIKAKWKRFAVATVMSSFADRVTAEELYDKIAETEGDEEDASLLEALFDEYQVEVYGQFTNLPIFDVVCQINELAVNAQKAEIQSD